MYRGYRNIWQKKKSICIIYKSKRRNKWKIEKRRQKKWGLASWFPFTQYTLPTWRCTQNFKTLAPIGAEKSVTEISIGEKEKWTIKRLISNMWLLFCYTIQLITIKLCTKFQNPNPSSCWEIFDEKKVYKKTDRQTNIITEKAKTIYPLYTLYRGYNEMRWLNKFINGFYMCIFTDRQRFLLNSEQAFS